MKLETHAVVIGGGVVGAAILYHLTKAGVSDCMLLERSELTAGSTWHAAGGVGTFGGGANAAWLHKYGFEMYAKLEAETGMQTGFHHVGEVSIARTEARLDDLRRHRALHRLNGVETFWLSPEELVAKVPVMDPATVLGAVFEPSYGHVDPSSTTNAWVAAARSGGAQVHRHTPVMETNQRPDGTWDVVTPAGTIHTQHVINAAGLWGREVGALAGVSLPMMPVEHHYFVTDRIDEVAALQTELPLIGDADAEYYLRQERDGLLLGVYEDTCTHWAEDTTPADFGHDLLPDALERIERNLAQAVEAVPCLGTAGVKRVINGPIMFSPDLAPLVGPYPGKQNYWCANGVMTGFTQAAGIGLVIAQWMTEGEPPLDVAMWDVARFGPWADKAYVKARTGDMYATRFKTVYPYEERPAGRPVLTTPTFELYKAKGAVFGASDGVEFPLWFAPEGVQPKDTLTYDRPNWFKPVGEECRALTSGVGLIDISTYGKHSVRGPGAYDWLNQVMAGRIPTRDGRLTLTAMLNENGKVEGEFSVLRLAPEDFLLIGSGTADRTHHRYWQSYLPRDGVDVASQTLALNGISVSGPNARALLQRLTSADLSPEAWAYARGARVDLGPAKDAIVIRVAYTGEQGFEVWVPRSDHLALVEALLAAAADLGVTLAGIRALNSLRIEKGFGAWGLEYSPDYTPWESGMDRLVRLDKGNFVGRDAALASHNAAKRYVMGCFTVDTPGPDPWGGEPIEREGEVVGYISSTAYGHRVNQVCAIGYLYGPRAHQTDGLTVDVLGTPRPVTALNHAPFDPQGQRMRS
ncbi:MAG: FAD-dependent oxidoreductase [Pseudomonadota bacterium]